MEKQTGKRPSALEVEPLPFEVAHYWEWFCSVRRQERLTYQELESWARLSRVPLSAFDTSVLMELDRVVAEALDHE